MPVPGGGRASGAGRCPLPLRMAPLPSGCTAQAHTVPHPGLGLFSISTDCGLAGQPRGPRQVLPTSVNKLPPSHCNLRGCFRAGVSWAKTYWGSGALWVKAAAASSSWRLQWWAGGRGHGRPVLCVPRQPTPGLSPERGRGGPPWRSEWGLQGPGSACLPHFQISPARQGPQSRVGSLPHPWAEPSLCPFLTQIPPSRLAHTIHPAWPLLSPGGGVGEEGQAGAGPVPSPAGSSPLALMCRPELPSCPVVFFLAVGMNSGPCAYKVGALPSWGLASARGRLQITACERPALLRPILELRAPP